MHVNIMDKGDIFIFFVLSTKYSILNCIKFICSDDFHWMDNSEFKIAILFLSIFAVEILH